MGGKEKKTAVNYWISQAEEEAAKRHSLEKLQRQQTERSTQAYARAQSILREYGISKETQKMTGEGGRTIGARYGMASYRETIPVAVKSDPKEGKIYLKEMVGARSGYRFGINSIDLIHENNEKRSESLLSIKNGQVLNFSGEEISLGEFVSLNEVLDFLEKEYKKRKKEIEEQREAAFHRSSSYTDLFGQTKASAE